VGPLGRAPQRHPVAAVVGARIGRTHAAGYAASERAELVAICDAIESRCHALADAHDVEARYTDFESMLREQRPDVLSIATPQATHAPLTILAASRYGTASPSFGVGFEFDVITAVILGGVRFTGGEGNILGVMLAVALLGVINSGLVSLGVNPFWTEVVKGVALIVAVGLDQITHEQRQRRRTQLAMQERSRSEPGTPAGSHI